MPRLSKKEYLHYHRLLRRTWLDQTRIGVYGYLQPRDQWYLHDFFKPSLDLSDQELLDHRENITKEQPSLPHQAGRALSLFLNVLSADTARARMPKPAARKRSNQREIKVRGIVQPELDIDKLAQAFLMLGRDIAKQKTEAARSPEEREADRFAERQQATYERLLDELGLDDNELEGNSDEDMGIKN